MERISIDDARMCSPMAQNVVLISCLAVLCLRAQAAAPVTPNAAPCPLPKGPILGELKIAPGLKLLKRDFTR